MARKISVFVDFTDEYKEICKQAWYSAGRPLNPDKIYDAVPEDSQGKKPKPLTLKKWRADYLWDFWADELDSRAITVVEDELVSKKIEMLKRHADMASELQTSGMNYLKETGFDTSSSAVSAIIKGAELERLSRGVGETLQKLSTMNDVQLKDEIIKYINRASENNQIIDVDLIEKEDTDKKE